MTFLMSFVYSFLHIQSYPFIFAYLTKVNVVFNFYQFFSNFTQYILFIFFPSSNSSLTLRNTPASLFIQVLSYSFSAYQVQLVFPMYSCCVSFNQSTVGLSGAILLLFSFLDYNTITPFLVSLSYSKPFHISLFAYFQIHVLFLH